MAAPAVSRLRAATSALLAVGAMAVLAGGCNPVLSRREVVVQFAAGTPVAQQRAVLVACKGAAPHTWPERVLPTKYASSRAYDVRFRVDHANDHDLARLYACLSKQPGVVGVDDPMDMTR